MPLRGKNILIGFFDMPHRGDGARVPVFARARRDPPWKKKTFFFGGLLFEAFPRRPKIFFLKTDRVLKRARGVFRARVACRFLSKNSPEKSEPVFGFR